MAIAENLENSREQITSTQREDFRHLRDGRNGEERILKILAPHEADLYSYLAPWFSFSEENEKVYPSQGIVYTPFDELDYVGTQILDEKLAIDTLRSRAFFLSSFNHPYRLSFLKNITLKPFTAPKEIESDIFDTAQKRGESLSIGDFVTTLSDGLGDRISRNDRYAQGPFIKLGKYARTPFVGSEMPDLWGSAASIATMAASLSIATLPRNGLHHKKERQAALFKESQEWLQYTADIILAGREDKEEVLNLWRRNIVVTLEPTFDKAIDRAEELYKVGARAFRVYSPEPGGAIIETTRKLREAFGDEIELFTGQVVGVEQAQMVEEAGADLIIVGIGGGGRCTTPLRSGTAVDWPELVWNLRGKIGIPVVVQGGASDHVATSLLLGASGIGVSRAVAGGTIESPGGLLFCVDTQGKIFKPYGGEASARTKYLDGKMLPFGSPSFVEGETTKAYLSFVRHNFPTIPNNLHHLLEEAILTMVFQGAKNISDLHAIDPSRLRRVSSFGEFQRNTH